MATIKEQMVMLTRRLHPTGRAFNMHKNSDYEKMQKALIDEEIAAINGAKNVLNQILPDNINFTEADAADWERRLAIRASSTTPLEDRKDAIKRKYAAPGDIPARSNYRYLERELQAAGFDVYVHENRQINSEVGTWGQVGNSFVDGTFSSGTAIVGLTSTRIALFKETDNEIKTYDFDGTDWVQVGNSFSFGAAQGVVMARLTDSRIAICENTSDELRTYDFDGTDWSLVGNALNLTSTGNMAIAGLSSTRVALADNNGDTLETYDFDGTDWSLVGNALVISGMLVPAIGGLTSSRIAYIDSSNDDLRTYDFDGTDWAQVGNDLNIPSVPNFAQITGMTSARIAYVDDTNDELRTYDFDGTDWAEVPNSLSTVGTGMKLTRMDSDRIAFFENTSDELRVYELSIANVYGTIPIEAVFGNQYGTFQYGQEQYGPNFANLDLVANYIDTDRDNLFVLSSDHRATFFVGGQILGDPADVPIERRDEFRQLILFLKPLQTVGLLLINYT